MNELLIGLAALQTHSRLSQKSFPAQDAFIQDKSQFLAALCTRRAGKTNALAKKFINTMKLHSNSLSRYIALTRDSAKDIMWPVLEELDEREELNANFNESNLTMTLPNGAKLRLMGADMKNFIRRLKGVKSPAVAVDEAQEFGAHLETLIDEVLTPTISDYENSWIALTGTPGPIPRGFFYDLTNSGIGDYSLHRWSLFDNPYLPNAQAFVDQLKKRKKWDDRNPTYLREYKGLWVLDLESLVIQYKEDAHFESLPPANWNYLLGIDLGFNDADALAVLAYSDTQSSTFLVEENIQPKQGITELVIQIQVLAAKYSITKMVIDEGGLGKKIAEEIRRRHQIPVLPADKSRKMENVALLNDALRTGAFKAKKNSRFAQDSYQLQIDHDKTTPDRIVVKKGFHSDIIDAVLYAFKESYAFTYQKPIPSPQQGTPEWMTKETTDMERAAEEYFKEQAELTKGYDEWGF